MNKFSILFLLSFCISNMTGALAQEAEESTEQTSKRYREAGTADADKLAQKFEETAKPRYQKAYDDYLADLEIIRATGVAADDQNLYNDLLKMSGEGTFVYSESERGINRFRGNAFR